jgi:glucose-1-phosphate thymidylyltransferase
LENSVVIQPSFIDDDVVIKNSVVGPYVSVGKGTIIENSVIQNSIVQTKSNIKNKLIGNSMIGNSVKLEGRLEDLSIGDFNALVQ